MKCKFRRVGIRPCRHGENASLPIPTIIWLANKRKVKVTDTSDEDYQKSSISLDGTHKFRAAAISMSITPRTILPYSHDKKRLARIFTTTERHLDVNCAQQHSVQRVLLWLAGQVTGSDFCSRTLIKERVTYKWRTPPLNKPEKWK